MLANHIKITAVSKRCCIISKTCIPHSSSTCIVRNINITSSSSSSSCDKLLSFATLLRKRRFHNHNPTFTTHQCHHQQEKISYHHNPKNKQPKKSFVNSIQAPSNFNPQAAIVYENIISSYQGEVLQNDILKLMRRKRRFEKGHWDAVITNYKEIELPISSSSGRRTLSDESYGIIDDIQSFLEYQHSDLFLVNNEKNGRHNVVEDDNDDDDDEKDGIAKEIKWLQVHAIHLKENGSLSAHVDSVRFSGGIVAGLSLSSSSIMRLKPASPFEIVSSKGGGGGDDSKSQEGSDDCCDISNMNKSIDDGGHIDLYLPPLSLYILSGICRYEYTHELLESGHEFVFQNEDGEENNNGLRSIEVHRKDRISVIFRDAKC